MEERMKKGQEYTGVVERVDFPNKGIVFVEETPVVVKNTIAGQKVHFRIAKCKNKKVEGTLLEIETPSEIETIVPPCPHFGFCGGCLYQTFPYEEQYKMKADQIKRLLGHVIQTDKSMDELFEGILPSPKEYRYRNKMEFSFGDEVKGGALALGLHKRGSFYDIVNVTNCQIVHADYNQILKIVLEVCSRFELNYYHRLTHLGYLRHLLVRRAEKTGEILVDLVTTSKWPGQKTEDEFFKELVCCLKSVSLEDALVGILHTVNDSLADVVHNDKTEILEGRDYICEDLLGLQFKISVFSFFQTNSLGAEQLYQTVREFVGETKDQKIFDLYSGTGTIAQLLAPVAKKVIGVEIVEEAVQAAKENAKQNGLGNCEFIAGDVLKVLEDLQEQPDIIVLDPPRDGIHPKALKRILEYGVERIVYISCKPTSLCRDLESIQEKGYEVERIKCVDMFPGGMHVECVVLMSRVGK